MMNNCLVSFLNVFFFYLFHRDQISFTNTVPDCRHTSFWLLSKKCRSHPRRRVGVNTFQVVHPDTVWNRIPNNPSSLPFLALVLLTTKYTYFLYFNLHLPLPRLTIEKKSETLLNSVRKCVFLNRQTSDSEPQFMHSTSFRRIIVQVTEEEEPEKESFSPFCCCHSTHHHSTATVEEIYHYVYFGACLCTRHSLYRSMYFAPGSSPYGGSI